MSKPVCFSSCSKNTIVTSARTPPPSIASMRTPVLRVPINQLVNHTDNNTARTCASTRRRRRCHPTRRRSAAHRALRARRTDDVARPPEWRTSDTLTHDQHDHTTLTNCASPSQCTVSAPRRAVAALSLRDTMRSATYRCSAPVRDSVQHPARTQHRCITHRHRERHQPMPARHAYARAATSRSAASST
jgi:hypothetical protein